MEHTGRPKEPSEKPRKPPPLRACRPRTPPRGTKRQVPPQPNELPRQKPRRNAALLPKSAEGAYPAGTGGPPYIAPRGGTASRESPSPSTQRPSPQQAGPPEPPSLKPPRPARRWAGLPLDRPGLPAPLGAVAAAAPAMQRLLRPGPPRLPPGPPARLLPLPPGPPARLPFATLPRALGSAPRLARLGLGPPLPLVPLRSAASASPKGAGVSPDKAATDPSGENKKLNKSQQLKQVFKEYGAVGVSFHVGISLISLGIFYLAVSSGVDMAAVLFKLGFTESSLQSKLAAGTSTFVLAYAVHKVFAPVRISITLVSVPFLVRYCRKIGFFKPPAPNP